MSEQPLRSARDLRLNARDRLRSDSRSCQALVGLDGFIDEIIHVVDQRLDFDRYTRLSSMAAYAQRLGQAAGKSCNVEWVVQRVKLGGNGPLMANALGNLGTRLVYVGAVGWPEVHPVFESLRDFGEVVTLADPGHTDAVEFEDGKVMCGKIETMKDVRWQRLLERLGGEEKLRGRLEACDLIALANWTMLPFANEIFDGMIALLRAHGPAKAPMFFFDLADPEKRTREDLAGVIRRLGEYSREGFHIMLGLNHKEAQQVAAVLGRNDLCPDDTPSALRRLAEAIVAGSGITELVVHPRHRAAAATATGSWCVEGPFTPRPRLSTGAGDHFNGGYCHGRLHGLEPESALAVGTATSGYYVRFGGSPSPAALEQFLGGWADGAIPEPLGGQ